MLWSSAEPVVQGWAVSFLTIPRPIRGFRMKVGILSDTHDQVDRTVDAVAMLVAGGAEALVHCGDLTTAEIVQACAALPCHYVMGNNDFDLDELQRQMEATGGNFLGWSGEIRLAGKRIAVTHGHLEGEFRRLLRSMPDYLCYGHTHDALNERGGPTRQINPGALHRARVWTVALLDLDDDRVEFLVVR